MSWHVCFIFLGVNVLSRSCFSPLLFSDGLGGLGGVWPALQRDPQPGCHGCSGHAVSKFLLCQPTLFPMWVSRQCCETEPEPAVSQYVNFALSSQFAAFYLYFLLSHHEDVAIKYSRSTTEQHLLFAKNKLQAHRLVRIQRGKQRCRVDFVCILFMKTLQYS